MRGDSEAAAFRGDEGGDPRVALPQAQPASAGSAPGAFAPPWQEEGYKQRGERHSTEQERSVLRAPNARTRPQNRQYRPLVLR